MREKFDEIVEQMEDCEVSTREVLLALAVAFLSGVVLGIIFSPKKHIVIASNNGSNNCDSSCDWDFDDDFDDEDE